MKHVPKSGYTWDDGVDRVASGWWRQNNSPAFGLCLEWRARLFVNGQNPTFRFMSGNQGPAHGFKLYLNSKMVSD